MQDSTFLTFIIYVLSRIVKHSDFAALLERAFEPFPEGNDPGPGQKVVDQHSADGGLDGAPAHMELESLARELWHESVSSSIDAVLSRFFADTPSIAQSEERRQDFLRK